MALEFGCVLWSLTHLLGEPLSLELILVYVWPRCAIIFADLRWRTLLLWRTPDKEKALPPRHLSTAWYTRIVQLELRNAVDKKGRTARASKTKRVYYTYKHSPLISMLRIDWLTDSVPTHCWLGLFSFPYFFCLFQIISKRHDHHYHCQYTIIAGCQASGSLFLCYILRFLLFWDIICPCFCYISCRSSPVWIGRRFNVEVGIYHKEKNDKNEKMFGTRWYHERVLSFRWKSRIDDIESSTAQMLMTGRINSDIACASIIDNFIGDYFNNPLQLKASCSFNISKRG